MDKKLWVAFLSFGRFSWALANVLQRGNKIAVITTSDKPRAAKSRVDVDQLFEDKKALAENWRASILSHAQGKKREIDKLLASYNELAAEAGVPVIEPSEI